jgi:drug/metabolite transporter (DMT)-like permease
LALASCGLVYLVLPGLKAPSLSGSLLMALAGVMWGIYSLRGRGSADPLQLNMSNFVRALPLVLMVSLLARSHVYATSNGFVLALVSGAITSGLGYVLWYTALRHLTAARAAIVQLMVPILAAGGGVAFLGETISLRLVASGIVVLGGIALALTGGQKFR